MSGSSPALIIFIICVGWCSCLFALIAAILFFTNTDPGGNFTTVPIITPATLISSGKAIQFSNTSIITTNLPGNIRNINGYQHYANTSNSM